MKTLLCCVFLAGIASAAGLSFHLEAADRALARLEASEFSELFTIVREHADSFRLGALFPDGAYAWDATHDAAEAAHWPDLHGKALKAWAVRHPRPWKTAEDRRMVAFILGMACHGAMDDVWHFGGGVFWQAATAEDLARLDPEDPEQIIEVATDMLVQAAHRPGREQIDWRLPSAQLVALFADCGYPELDARAIRRSLTLLRAGVAAEDRLGRWAAPAIRATLPFTSAHYESWQRGGIDSGAALTVEHVERLWRELVSEGP